MSEIYKVHEGTKSKVANYVPEPSDGRSVMEILADLSESNPKAYEEAIDRLIAEKGTEWFKNLRYNWSINGRPKQFPPMPLEKWRAWVVLAGRGFGKALSVLTPILTDSGWKTIGTLLSKDLVYNEYGDLVKITDIGETFYNRPCYKVTFSDNSSVVADANHLWKVSGRLEREKKKDGIIRTTEEMFVLCQQHPQNYKFSIPYICLNFSEKEIPLHPYILGFWLGGGNSNKARLCIVNHADEVKSIITSLGHVLQRGDGIHYSIQGLDKFLRKLNVLNNKHIPESYKFNSVEVRLDLLRGLFDSDGFISNSEAVFANSNKIIINDVEEILCSLGIKYRKRYIKPIRNKQESWHLLVCNPNIELFKIKDKLAKVKISPYKRPFKYIDNIEIAQSEPVKCITVDSLSGLFLVGKEFHLTHNSRTGAETVRMAVDNHKNRSEILRIALVGPTTSEVNKVMINGNSGILSLYPENEKPEWRTTNRQVVWRWPDGTTKAIADAFSAEEPQRLRGPQFHFAWVDELAAFRYPEAWDMLMFGLRLGDNPQVVVTTTPRPYPILLDLLKLKTTWTTIGSTYENRSNLAPAFFGEIITKYEGTTLGRQELMAEIIEEVPNAMWNYENLDENRISYDHMERLPEFLSVVLAIDPATSTRKSSAETGMCVAAYGEDDHFYILHLDAVKMSPEQWASRAIKLFEQYNCDKMIAEVNNGGDLVEAVIKAKNPLQKVYAVHASRGKAEDLNNPILTAEGWKTFGTLKDSDLVFNSKGKQTSLELLPIHESECAEITFSDGTSGVYAMEHEWDVLNYKHVRTVTSSNFSPTDWETWKSSDRGNYLRSCSTEMKHHITHLRALNPAWLDISESAGVGVEDALNAFTYDSYLNTISKFEIKSTEELMKNIQRGEVYMLPSRPQLEFHNCSRIDPYLLGLWLADGCVGSSSIAQKTPEDTEKIIEELESRGFEITLRHGLINIKNMRWAFAGRTKKELYPDEWMIREDERLDLIRGLIDGGGTRKSNTSISLSESGYKIDTVLYPAIDAMRSLGWNVGKPYINETIKEPAKEPAMSVTINPIITECAGLKSKHIDFVPHSSFYRTITSIKPVGIRDVRCISVHSPDHLYLSGRGLITTHNSTRAEPIASLYEQNRVHHIGRFGRGEEQMCIVGDTLVSAYNAKQISKRLFTGLLIEVKTLHNTLTMTYNHPVLTQRGWIEARNLTKEDMLYYARKELQSIRIEDAYTTVQNENLSRIFKTSGETFTISKIQNERTWARDKEVSNLLTSLNEKEPYLQSLYSSSDKNIGILQNYECSIIQELRSIEVKDLPVYNLSTSTEWYIANGFITHNCSFNPLENPYGLKDMVDALVWAMTWLVDTTQGKNHYKPSVGGFRAKLEQYKNIFRY